jgi:membrane-associated phospholipid phosphatase
MRRALVAFGLFAVLALVALGPVPGVDRSLHDWVVRERTAPLTSVARALTLLGSSLVVWPALLLSAAILARGRQRWQLPVALGVGQVVRVGVNVAVHRPRPPRTDRAVVALGHAFPSGHTFNATVGWGLVALLCGGAWAWSATVGIALAVGLTRIELGVHWPTDVLGAWLLGLGWLLMVGWWGEARRLRGRPARPAPG